MVRVEGQQKIVTLPSILKEKGYSTLFMYGGDTKFDNMQGFLIPKGFDTIINQYDFNQNLVLNKWGIPDEFVFDRLATEIDYMNKNNDPFFAMILTLTNHSPYTIPDVNFGKIKTNSELNDNYNTFKYADYCLGKFFEKVSKKQYFKDTIFVITGDHSKTLHHDLAFDYRKSYVPCLFYAPNIDILKPKINDKISSHIDIAPTIFNIMNMTTKNNFCGKNMLTPKNNEKDFAIIISGTDLGYIKNDFFYNTKIGFNEKNKLYKYKDFSGIDYKSKYPTIFENMQKEAYALQETAYLLFKKRRIAE
jgi:phosphoglycerol transferase MdoB-like AlkP superfamily enzyme